MQSVPKNIEKKRILTRKEVSQMTGFGKSTIYRLIQQSKFPRNIKTGIRTNGWLREDIENWLRECKDASYK